MKKIFISALLLSGAIVFAQTGKVGINTERPEATLSVKSKPKSEPYQKSFEAEDSNGKKLFTIMDNGKVGIGIDAPTTQLHIVSSLVNGGFRLKDGSEKSGRVLTSDDYGNASWAMPTMSYAYSTGKGVHNEKFPASALPAIADKYHYTGMKITLPSKGKYAVMLDLGISSIISRNVMPLLNHNIPYTDENLLSAGQSIMVKGTFWDEILDKGIDKNTIDDTPSKNKANSLWQGTLNYPNYLQRQSNTLYIENPTDTPKTYYFYAMATMVDRNTPPSTRTHYIYELASGRWAEESLIAFKIGE